MKLLSFQGDVPYASNTHVLISEGEALVVDPSIDADVILSNLTGEVDKISAVVLTHAHFDHMLCIDSYYAKSIPILVGREDIPVLKDSRLNCYMQFSGQDISFTGEVTQISEGDKISVGREVLTVMETPGHTPGSISLYTDGVLVSGDLIFAGGGFGRYDLPGGDYKALFESISRVGRLPKGTRVLTGHGPDTYIN